MTNQKHTSGPWRARKIKGYTAFWAVDAPMVEDREPQVCKVAGGMYINAPQTEANARLIAAAPDLLEALGALLERVRCYEAWLSNRLIASRSLTEDEKGILKDIRQSAPEAQAAISKARGDE